MQKVTFELRGKKAKGELVSENEKTVWVKLKNGAVIKRHREKHMVEVV